MLTYLDKYEMVEYLELIGFDRINNYAIANQIMLRYRELEREQDIIEYIHFFLKIYYNF